MTSQTMFGRQQDPGSISHDSDDHRSLSSASDQVSTGLSSTSNSETPGTGVTASKPPSYGLNFEQAKADEINDESKFKECLLARIQDPVHVSTTLAIQNCKNKVLLSHCPQMYYTIFPSECIFQLWNPDESIPSYVKQENDSEQLLPYFELKYAKGRSFSMAGNNMPTPGSQIDLPLVEGDGDVFLALGYIIERTKDGLHKTTQYVCAINVSTTPHTMWLIFDHGHWDGYGDLEEKTSPDSQSWYNDPLYDYRRSTPGEESPWKQENGYMNQPEPWDIALLYQNLEHWPSSLPEEIDDPDTAPSPSSTGGNTLNPQISTVKSAGEPYSALRVMSSKKILARQS